jgi:superoxide reductase
VAKRFAVYRCEKCGNIVEVLIAGEGEPSCCGAPMTPLTENSTDAAREKHVPEIEEIPDGYRVCVGSVSHPMEEKHYIQWIELLGEGISCRKFLRPGEKPEAVFGNSFIFPFVTAREYCNLHGLWNTAK